MPRRSIAEVLTGAIVLLVAAGFLAYAIAHSGRSTASGYTLYARFDHVDGLMVGADVRLAGVKVGSVTAATVDPKTFLATVSFTVRSGIALPKDTSASITAEGLLGGNYLSLSPGGDEVMLQPGQTITITQSAVNLEELLGKFIFSASNLASATKGGAPDKQSTGGQATAPNPAPPPGAKSP
jgi:phospholipid/cholesterol/gamma-HCH transport system substrate-binding protein